MQSDERKYRKSFAPSVIHFKAIVRRGKELIILTATLSSSTLLVVSLPAADFR
jgi:hypothetical protein